MDPQLERLQHEISSAIHALTPEQLTAHPSGKWCTAEVLEHLYLTYTGTIKGFERVIGQGTAMVSSPTWRQRIRALVVVELGYLPSGREAPAVARPRGIPSEKVISEILSKITEMDDMIQRCEQKFGAEEKLLDHPILGPLNARRWRKFHLIHGLHHVKQIRKLTSQTA